MPEHRCCEKKHKSKKRSAFALRFCLLAAWILPLTCSRLGEAARQLAPAAWSSALSRESLAPQSAGSALRIWRTCRWPRAKPPAAVATKNPGRFWTGGAQMPSAFPSKMAFPSFPAHGFLKTPSDILGRYALRAKGQSSSRPLKQNEVFVCSFRHSLRSVGKLVFSHKLGSRLFQQKTAAPEKPGNSFNA